MKISRYSLFISLALLSVSFAANSQDDLLKLVDSSKSNETKAIPTTWKDTRLINIQTTKTVAPGVMEFFILHRFGNVGGASGGGIHTLGGFDIGSDIQFSFQFGITKNLEVGFSRSKQLEMIDLDAKYKLLTQNSTGMPISLAVYGDAGITPVLNSTFYPSGYTEKELTIDRLSYFGELMIDRRFGNHFSLEVLGGMQHRNYLFASTNPNNGAGETNNLPFVGGGARIMFNKHSSLVFDAYYLLSKYRTNYPVSNGSGYFMPISVGYEVETGGHVFEVNFSNAAYLDENNIIPSTHDTWTMGGFKLGFSISRVFGLHK